VTRYIENFSLSGQNDAKSVLLTWGILNNDELLGKIVGLSQLFRGFLD